MFVVVVFETICREKKTALGEVFVIIWIIIVSVFVISGLGLPPRRITLNLDITIPISEKNISSFLIGSNLPAYSL